MLLSIWIPNSFGGTHASVIMQIRRNSWHCKSHVFSCHLQYQSVASSPQRFVSFLWTQRWEWLHAKHWKVLIFLSPSLPPHAFSLANPWGSCTKKRDGLDWVMSIQLMLDCIQFVSALCTALLGIYIVLSVRFEVGVSLLLAPAGADKRGAKTPFPLVEIAELRREPGLTESTAL